MDQEPAVPVPPPAAAQNAAPGRSVQIGQYPYINPQQFARSPQTAALQSIPPSLVPFSRPWHIAKLVLGGLSILISVVLVAIAIALVSLYGLYSAAYVDLIMVAVVGGVAILWQIAENITICARPVHRGIHPGAHVGLHLLIAIGAALTMAFIAFFLASDVDELQQYQSLQNCDPTYYDCSSDGYYYGYGGFGDLSYGDIQTYVAMESALVAFATLLMIVHIVLFVRACVETHQRNSVARTVILIPSDPMSGAPGYYVPASQGMMRMSYAPFPQQTQEQWRPQQPQMQQVGPAAASMVPSHTSLSAAQPVPTNDAPAAVPSTYGYYVPTPTPQTAASPMVGNDHHGRPESSISSPSPISEPRQIDKGKQPEALPEEHEASGSGSAAVQTEE